jgi:hypothetical protein
LEENIPPIKLHKFDIRQRQSELKEPTEFHAENVGSRKMSQDNVMAMIVPHVEPSSAKVCIHYVSNPNYVTVKQQAIKSSEQGAY